MGIEEVAKIIQKISDGFEDACIECIAENTGVIKDTILQQLAAGLNSNEEHLSPSYDDDPFFDEEGFWHNRSKDYKAWKRTIVPPVTSTLGFSSRPDNIPNLYIDGTFYSDISMRRSGDCLITDPGTGNGPEIVGKYGDEILNIGPTAIEYFNIHYLIPAIDDYFTKCGYR